MSSHNIYRFTAHTKDVEELAQEWIHIARRLLQQLLKPVLLKRIKKEVFSNAAD